MRHADMLKISVYNLCYKSPLRMCQHESIVIEVGRGDALPKYIEEGRHAAQETTNRDGQCA
jgi:hypothetical protein